MAAPVESTQESFLIIVGTYRAGTTALFQYLAGHPQVAPAKRKEEKFFLPIGEGAPGPRAGRSPLSRYLARFEVADQLPELKVEATPRYLHEPDVARRIHDALPEARIVITLRDQVSRLISWYQTLRLTQRLEPDVSFAEYIERQFGDRRPLAERPVVDRAVQEGRYSARVEEFFDEFGRDRVLVVWFDDLIADPEATIQRIAQFGGIDPSFYEGLHFEPVNAARRMTAPRAFRTYLGLRRTVLFGASRLPNRAALRRTIRRLDRQVIDRLSAPALTPEVSPELVSRLRAYYADDNEELAALTGRPVPWVSPDRARRTHVTT